MSMAQPGHRSVHLAQYAQLKMQNAMRVSDTSRWNNLLSWEWRETHAYWTPTSLSTWQVFSHLDYLRPKIIRLGESIGLHFPYEEKMEPQRTLLDLAVISTAKVISRMVSILLSSEKDHLSLL